jgi:hypothetical protein
MAVSHPLAIVNHTMERGMQRAHLKVGITCVGIALAVVLMAWTGGSAHAGGIESRPSPSSPPNPAGPEYAVTFTESGLPLNTTWAVTLNGTQGSSTSTTLTFTEPDGTYLFTVDPIPGFSPDIPVGNVTVAGAAVGRTIEFAPTVTFYTLTFEQAGLPAGLVWSVTFNGSTRDTNSSSALVFSGPNGTYPFTVGSVPGFRSEPSAGNVVVNGASVTERITFSPPTGQYVVTFTETGLALGTEWSITLNGTTQRSTDTTITFSEPNGSYLFVVSPVSGYTVNPEGNVTVNGGPVDVPLVYASTSVPSQSCTSFSWEEKNYTFRGNCIGQFETDYRWFSATSGSVFGNSTFDVAGVAEVTGSGTLDALAVPGYQGSGQMTVVYTPTAINITDVIVGNVTTVLDLNSTTYTPNGETPEWAPNEAPGGGGASFWGNGPLVLGNVTIVVVFHFDNQSGPASNLVKFDVMVKGWPWVSSSDQLGLALHATAEQGTHFVYSSAADTIAQEWDSNGTVATSLEFGPSANATDPPSALQASDEVGLTPSGPSPTAAVALLTFAGPGGYSGLVYDPWIVFGSGGSSVFVPPPPPAGGATLPLVAVGAIAFAASVLGLLSYRVRRHSIDEGLASRV